MSLAARCVSLDLEVGKSDKRIHALAAVRTTGEPLLFTKGLGGAGLARALGALDAYADGAEFVLGHNLIAFDLPHLAAAKPGLQLLALPAVDTLRLSPLAFPANPYHHLVKHYQDGALLRGQINNPELDARQTLELFADEEEALGSAAPSLLLAWHWLTTGAETDRGFDAFFTSLRGASRPTVAEAEAAIEECFAGNVCVSGGRKALEAAAQDGWPLAYTLAWLSVAGGNSVMPPWVRHQFPAAAELLRGLRDTACTDDDCVWCREHHNPRKVLKRWFGFDDFREEPAWEDGRPMQLAIVEAAMAGKNVLGLLPTGAGKSLCYQLPALSRYDNTGALTVVVSPLVALMADQVAGLEARGISSCVTINGMLSMPERADALDRVRLGGAAILLISPEQLRSRSVRSVLAQRDIGAWVLDEAHCLSRWGHDFRPDYRYVGRFIRERAGESAPPPVMCVTATAKPEVVAEIKEYFRKQLGIEILVFDGGAERKNLEFEVAPTNLANKNNDIHDLLMNNLPPQQPGGAIVYCATRRHCEETAEYLKLKNVEAAYFHAGLTPEKKQDTQRRFIAGKLRVIVATNAFGMGIDKPDVRLVIHADIPGSLENYLQEAGRAGRDQEFARCVLLYVRDDVERQFGMSARGRLSRREIQGILRALRKLDRKQRLPGEVVATPGEILVEDDTDAFARDSVTDDTRVKTAVSWLEEAQLLTREENHVQVFPSSLRVQSVAQARARLDKKDLTQTYRKQLLSIVETLIEADPDEGISTDELMAVTGSNSEGIRHALYDLEQLGIASNDTVLTAFVHAGVERASKRRMQEAAQLETALIDHLREAAPDLDIGDSSLLHLRIATQALKDAGLKQALPERLSRILRSIAQDGRGEDRAEQGSTGSISLRRVDRDNLMLTLRRSWQDLAKTAELRRTAAGLLLDDMLAALPSGAHGTDLLVETTLGKLHAALQADLVLNSQVRNTGKLLDRALLWLHEQEVIRLSKGLSVFRSAMTIRLARQGSPDEPRPGGAPRLPPPRFTDGDFKPLGLHYREQVLQIHVMAEFATRGLKAIAEALRLAMDYFTLEHQEFLDRWLPDKGEEVTRQTTPETWRHIVDELNNPLQRRIVTDNRERTNVLVLAGPGSGKTKVLVHRIAYLLRVRRERPSGILALAYNRHAASEIRRRLQQLVGDDARGVTVLTCHGLAMRLTGASFAAMHKLTAEDRPADVFGEVLQQAVALLQGKDLQQKDLPPGEDLLPGEAGEQRERLLAGFRWILVDEYQDINADQYELISALAGRKLADEDSRLTLFAVGDDDQNIYSFNGASVEFIRRFNEDYDARPNWLTENYRSTAHIIATSNAFIEPARLRMKNEHPIQVNRARGEHAPGGMWEEWDPVARGQVQMLPAGVDPGSQALAVMTEFKRLAELSSAAGKEWDWRQCAVIAREWRFLDPVRSLCELEGIPVQMADEDMTFFWRLRETRRLRGWLANRKTRLVDGAALDGWLRKQTAGGWMEVLGEAIAEYKLEAGDAETSVEAFTEWLAEWGRELRRRQTGLLLLTAHRAKGLEFDHVIVLDGNWRKQVGSAGDQEDPDAWRRLYYVAMTRARETLTLASLASWHGALGGSGPFSGVHEQPPAVYAGIAAHIPDIPAVLRRDRIELPKPPPQLGHRFKSLSLGDVHLSWPGRFPTGNPIHAAIRQLKPGDELALRTGQIPWEITTPQGQLVGCLAKKFQPRQLGRLHSARVHAVVNWRREDNEPEYQDRLRCDEWEVVLPELVFEPEQK